MKYFFSLLFILAGVTTGIAQNGFYIKYEAAITSTSEDEDEDENEEIIAVMKQGRTMELAISPEKNWVKTQVGNIMTVTMELNIAEKKTMTILMEGTIGTMAFRGDPEELKDTSETLPKMELFLNESKTILGYECKKASLTDAEGNTTVFWYTEKIASPEGISQMPDQIPGLSLQFENASPKGVTVTYTAVQIEEQANMSAYQLIIPEGTEISDLKQMAQWGGR